MITMEISRKGAKCAGREVKNLRSNTNSHKFTIIDITMSRNVFFIFCILSTSIYALDVDAALKQVPLKDRVQMRHFFHEVVNHDNFGYVLFFSDKPVALTSITTHRGKHFKKTLVAKGWQSWKKYEHLFPHENYIFCEDKRPFSSMSCDHLYLINRASLQKCLMQNIESFQKILGKTFSPNEFIEALEQGQNIKELIKNDQMLMGILMGFDETSAEAYKRRRLNAEEHSDVFERIPPIQNKLIINKNHNNMYAKSCGMQSVTWIGNPNLDEVIELSKIYSIQQRKLIKIYKRRNSLKTTLRQLCLPTIAIPKHP